MTPVDQTIFGEGGNCYSACIASLLNRPVEEVPYFMGEDRWFEAVRDWLRPRGFDAVCFDANGRDLDGIWRPRGLCILGGKGPRGPDHAVVGRGLATIHDPHPSRDGLTKIEDVTIIFPLDPAAVEASDQADDAGPEVCPLHEGDAR